MVRIGLCLLARAATGLARGASNSAHAAVLGIRVRVPARSGAAGVPGFAKRSASTTVRAVGLQIAADRVAAGCAAWTSMVADTAVLSAGLQVEVFVRTTVTIVIVCIAGLRLRQELTAAIAPRTATTDLRSRPAAPDPLGALRPGVTRARCAFGLAFDG